jgi:hypothetical protein
LADHAGWNFARHAGFAVSLSGAGTETQGIVLCNQLRILDLQARKARFIERMPDFIVDEVLAKILPPRRMRAGGWPACVVAKVMLEILSLKPCSIIRDARVNENLPPSSSTRRAAY